MLQLRDRSGREDLALVYLLQVGRDPRRLIETVDAVDPRFPRCDKAVIIISTQVGCPVACLMCDAGGGYLGDLSAEEMLGQVRFVLRRRPEILGSRKLKVHFARMGEPALNQQVLEALRLLPREVPAEGLFPCVASVAPAGSGPFFDELVGIRHQVYAGRPFQLQFSLNTTDERLRAKLIPTRLLELDAIAEIGRRFHRPGQRKVVLNFALAEHLPLDVTALRAAFDPACFAVKLTPLNPTDRAWHNDLRTILDAAHPDAADPLVAELARAGFDVVVSIGEPDEIAIGSNCGQTALRRAAREPLVAASSAESFSPAAAAPAASDLRAARDHR